jgi:hypothetical protein
MTTTPRVVLTGDQCGVIARAFARRYAEAWLNAEDRRLRPLTCWSADDNAESIAMWERAAAEASAIVRAVLSWRADALLREALAEETHARQARREVSLAVSA